VKRLQTLSAEERESIRAAIAHAEGRTQARFVFSMVPVSDRYLVFPLLWGALAAIAAAGLLAIFWPSLPLRHAFAAEAAILVGLSLVLDWLPLRLLSVPAHVKRAHAHDFAHREFAARILANPEHNGGIVLFISMGERYVRLLADRELHAKVGDAEWNRIVAELVVQIKRGKLSEGASGAIASCAAILERHCPRRAPSVDHASPSP